MTTVKAHPVLHPEEAVGSDLPDAASSTERLRSSVLEYRHENGRTYHRYKDGKYNLPNDGEENERLDFQHNLCLLTFENELGLSPPNHYNSNVKRVLDLGTGTGIWAIDFGDEHPDATIDDIDDDWTYSQPFDYIHSRFMNFSVQNWHSYLEKIFWNLTPGGYVELQDVDVIMDSDDGTLTPDTTLYQWCRLLEEAAVRFDRTFENTANFKYIMSEIGFVDIVETRFKWPTNRWPKDQKYKELGAWNNENASSAVEALTMAPFTRGLGWTREEVEIFLMDLRKDWNNPKIHAYWPICSVYARRPEI
ncbi:hypothetical protein FSARC_10323 [Fusarium sarcochroum]|uniref:Methyltransferase n=1 Tax=Fusarium sarcochroum TaxID=1208366 RepID=A0A8H4TN37_9HYPO|nr:hypothetical protein FSARC_10323 [Fusarium sarcochroum]